MYQERVQTLLAYQAAVNESSIVSITDLAGTILYINDKFTEISKYSSEELIGKTHRIISSNYHPHEFFQSMWDTIKRGEHWRGEIKNRAKDGTYYWVDTVITPVRDRKGTIFQYLSVRNLISLQKEHEENLMNMQKAYIKRDRQLRDAQEVAKTGSWHLDIPQNKLEWSAETYRIFELPIASPMTYESFLEKVHPLDRKIVDEAWNAALKGGYYEVEHRIVTQSGEKWVRERARLDFDSLSSLKEVLGTVQDITEKKKTEEILRKSEFLYKSLFNNSPFAIGILDKETLQFLEVNKTATTLYGYSNEEFLQLTAFDIRVPEERDKLKEQVEGGKYAGDSSVRPHKKKNGEIILIEPSITEIIYKDKPAFLISILDVTEKLKMQEEIFHANINKQKAIVRATMKAQEQSRAETGRELHDNINQLLVASTLYLKNIKPVSEKEQKHLETAKGIITNAIDEIRKLSSSFVPPALNELTLKDSIKHFSRNFKLTNMSVELDINIDESSMEDGLKINIYRIIQEQFNNIVKYAEATQVRISLKNSAGHVVLEIADNGKGFDQKKKRQGIGLTNIIHRAEIYNGRVMIESSPGNGCKIRVEFTWPAGS